MELTKIAIDKNFEDINGLEGYRVVISKIEENINSYPDISIEACKSLIEGLCLKSMSLLSDKYITNKTYRKRCKNDLTFLTNNVFQEVFSDFVESVIHKNLSELVLDASIHNRVKVLGVKKFQKQTTETIGKISAIRNERGDISHGKIYPKRKESHLNFAKSMQSITDGLCSFIIYELAIQYKNKVQEDNRLNFEMLEKFNEWLDNKHEVLSIKVNFSELIYKNAYDKYEEYYYLEYVDSEDFEEDVEIKEEKSIETDEPEKVVAEVEQPKNKIKKLVNTFDEASFWIEPITEKVATFAATENLKTEELRKLITDYLFSENKPLRDDVALAMNEKPALKNKAKIIVPLTDKITAFADELKNPTEE